LEGEKIILRTGDESKTSTRIDTFFGNLDMLSAAYFSTCLVRNLWDFFKFPSDSIWDKNTNDLEKGMATRRYIVIYLHLR